MEEDNPIVTSSQDFGGNLVEEPSVFTPGSVFTDNSNVFFPTYNNSIDRVRPGEGQPIEVIPFIDSVEPGEGQPIDVIAPFEVEGPLYEIEFNRKLYGASIDVINTLQDIDFKPGYSGRNIPKLNIAYLALWKRGNSPNAGEKVSSDTINVSDANLQTDKATPAFTILENSPFLSKALLGIGNGPISTSITNLFSQNNTQPALNQYPIWEVRAPDAVEGNKTFQTPTITNSFTPEKSTIKINQGGTFTGARNTDIYQDPDIGNFMFADGFYTVPGSLDIFFAEKKEVKLGRLDLIKEAKKQLEEEKAKETPNQETIKYIEEKIKILENATDEQFEAGLELPPDPRVPAPSQTPPVNDVVKKADPGWGLPGELVNRSGTPTEKIEGIWQFLFNPQTLERSFGPEYKFASTWGVPDGQPAHYSGHKNQELRFRDIILNGFVFGKKVESLVKGLEELVHVEKNSGQQSPPILEFVWGKKVFGPCIMEDISITEQKWDGGELVDATLSFTLKQIPEWVVNDEYINIFNPVGQPLLQTIIEQPKPAETTTTGDGTTGDGSSPEGDSVTDTQNADNKDSKTCITLRTFANDFRAKYAKACQLANSTKLVYLETGVSNSANVKTSYILLKDFILNDLQKLHRKLTDGTSIYGMKTDNHLYSIRGDLAGIFSQNIINNINITNVDDISKSTQAGKAIEGMELYLSRLEKLSKEKGCGFKLVKCSKISMTKDPSDNNVSKSENQSILVRECGGSIKNAVKAIKNLSIKDGSYQTKNTYKGDYIKTILNSLQTQLNSITGAMLKAGISFVPVNGQRLKTAELLSKYIEDGNIAGYLSSTPENLKKATFYISRAGEILSKIPGFGTVDFYGCTSKREMLGNYEYLAESTGGDNTLRLCKKKALNIARVIVTGLKCPNAESMFK